MFKDNMVIEDGGMRYEFCGKGEENTCNSCCLEFKCVGVVEALCNTDDMRGRCCISATKIQPEPKMYFAWNREEASHLVGRKVEYHLEGKWLESILKRIDYDTSNGFPFYIIQGNIGHVREIPTTKLTLAKLIEMAGIEGDVEIVEEGE